MSVTPFFHLLWLLSGLGSVVFASMALGIRGMVLLAAGFALESAAARYTGVPDPIWVGTLTVILAGWALARRKGMVIAPFAGGVLAAVLGTAMHAEGVAALPAYFLAALPALIAMWLAMRQPNFVSATLHEEALLLILILALITAAAPGITAGWTSALALNLRDNESLRPMMPGWVIGLGCTALALGGVFTVWRRS